jgi:hypothetical protein
MNFQIEDESMSRRHVCFISKQKPHEISVWSLPNRSQEQRYNRQSPKLNVLDPASRGKSDIPSLRIPKPLVSHANSGAFIKGIHSFHQSSLGAENKVNI